ncbi:MAG: aminotransferase [Gammaproteobacteria bacterium]|nr:aminotransferase [Gammaproteobacteria bacterium]
MSALSTWTKSELEALQAQLTKELGLQKGNRLALDLTRGKPAADQLDLSAGLDDAIAGDYFAADGTDARNYGTLAGLPEARALGAELMDVSADDVICWGNSSLTLMHTSVDLALHGGLWEDGRRWSRAHPPKMLTPVPGYDRHFTICEAADIEMVNVAMTEHGPDMQQATRLAAEDPDIKGIWCVPKFSNPTGCIYSPECVALMADLPNKAAADDFVVMWDNAYAVHDFQFPKMPLSPILSAAREAGTENHVILFASTSKITYASGGLGFLASGANVVARVTRRLGQLSIGPDKVNQLRHARFLSGRLEEHMAAHAELIKPKFQAVEETLASQLGELDIASWSTPKGGYFVSLDTRPGLASRVGELAASAGLNITRPGATFPYGNDPEDRNLRIAPTFAALSDVKAAMQLLTLCVKLATVEQQLVGQA